MMKAWISTACHSVAGAVLGYLVFSDDAERFAWPLLLWVLLAGTIVTVTCSRVLVNGRAPWKVRAAATSTAGFAMLIAGVADDASWLYTQGPLHAALSVAMLIVMCNLYFLPSWIAALLPQRRPLLIVLLLATGCADGVLPLIMSDGTEYAAGFDEARFRELRPGTPRAEVKRVLGEPLRQQTFDDGETVFYYSRQRDERDNYRVRNVVFDGSGRMIRRVGEFYLD